MSDDLPLLGRNARKVAPLLRMISDGSASVNLARAEQSATIKVDEARINKAALKAHRPVERRALLATKADLPTPGLARVVSGVTASVFIQTTTPDAKVEIEGETARSGDLVLAEVPLQNLRSALAQPGVTYIEAGEALRRPRPRVEDGTAPAPSASQRTVDPAEHHKYGEDVLIGIIDVDGFDFAHPDFADGNGGTRFERIWDQGGSTRPSPSAADPQLDRAFSYGSELRKSRMDSAMAAATAAGVDATDLEPQSQMVPGSHGTHVASIAAGNAGVARKAGAPVNVGVERSAKA